jgi:hypothetical protein
MERTAMLKKPKRTVKRTVMSADDVTPIDMALIGALLRETFPDRELPTCDRATLAYDLGKAFGPITRIARDRQLPIYVKDAKKKLRNSLIKLEDTPKNRWILAAVGRNHAGREKDKGIKARDMRSYDQLVRSTGYAHYEDFVEAEIQGFFRLRDQFIAWLSDDAVFSRMLGFLQPASMNRLITVDLLAIFKKHFPGEGTGNSPTSRCTQFISAVLRKTGIYDGDSPNEMIVKQRERARATGANRR